jgi:hypothetical protein
VLRNLYSKILLQQVLQSLCFHYAVKCVSVSVCRGAKVRSEPRKLFIHFRNCSISSDGFSARNTFLCNNYVQFGIPYLKCLGKKGFRSLEHLSCTSLSCPTTRDVGTWREKRHSSYSFSTSALDGGEWSASRPGCTSSPEERTPGTHCTGGWVGSRAGLDTEVRGKILWVHLYN